MDILTDQISANARSGQKPSKYAARSQAYLTPRATQGEQQQESTSSANSKRPRKNNTNSQNKQQAEPPAQIRSTTVIRRVQAVVNVKREDSDDECPQNLGHNEVVLTKKKEGSIQVAFTPAASVERQALPRKRPPRSKVINDEDEHEGSEGRAWGSGSDDLLSVEKVRLRRRGQINYREDEEDEDDDDELMMGSQVCCHLFYVTRI